MNEESACYGFFKANPLIYERCQDKRLGKEDYRKAVIKNYVLVYKVNEASQMVRSTPSEKSGVSEKTCCRVLPGIDRSGRAIIKPRRSS